jgi:hypothetical protein
LAAVEAERVAEAAVEDLLSLVFFLLIHQHFQL